MLLVAATVTRWLLARDGYFWQDDFAYLEIVKGGLSPEVLLRDYNDHVMPGTFLLTAVVSALGSSWGIALAINLALQVVAGLLLLWVIHLLFPRTLMAPVVYAAALFTPLTLTGTYWFAYGLQLWPLQASLLAGIGCFVRWRQTAQVRYAVGMICAYVCGLFFWEKALLFVPVLAGFALLVWERDLPIRARVSRARSELWVWALLLGVTVAYLVFYLARTETAGSAGGERSVSVLGFLNTAVLRTLLPGLLGGPWTAKGSIYTVGADPRAVSIVLTCLVWLAIVASSLRLRGKVAGQAWLWTLGCLALDYALLVAFRPDAQTLGRDSRYIADAVPLVALGVLAAFHHTPVRDASPATVQPTRVRLGIGLAAVVALVASAMTTTQALGDGLRHTYSRDYVRALTNTITQDPSRPLLDRAAPHPAVFLGRQSALASAVGVRGAWPQTAQDMNMFDAIGRIGPVTIPRPEFTRQGPQSGCGWLVSPGSPVVITDVPPLRAGQERVLQVGYLSQRVHDLVIVVDGGSRQPVPTYDVLGVITTTISSPARKIEVRVDNPGAAVCVASITLGRPVAKIEP
ncbi:hypothetical protein [Barrientosiimonas humi]|uniref:hypothetical protein n=1 Tax=Barrientosiimonas humi TaxID=999931 RepID=UPI00370D0074